MLARYLATLHPEFEIHIIKSPLSDYIKELISNTEFRILNYEVIFQRSKIEFHPARYRDSTLIFAFLLTIRDTALPWRETWLRYIPNWATNIK